MTLSTNFPWATSDTAALVPGSLPGGAKKDENNE